MDDGLVLLADDGPSVMSMRFRASERSLSAWASVIPIRGDVSPFEYSSILDQFVPRRTISSARKNTSPAEGSQHILGRKNRNTTEPAEILGIECDQDSAPNFVSLFSLR